MAILGLLGTEQYASERFKSVRRSVFYQYPNGAAPLVGLLSMLDGEVLNDPEYSWYEERFKEMVTTLAVNGTTSGPWYADSSGSLGSAAATTAANKTAGTAYWIKVNAYDLFKPNDILKLKGIPVTGGTADLQVRILQNSSGVWYTDNSGYWIRVTPINTLAAVTNVYTDYASIEAQCLGNANMQGQTGTNEGAWTIPGTVANATQIQRTGYSFTNTALVTSAKFDETGPYKDKAKKASIKHMIQIELQFILGEYSKSVDSTSQLPTFTTGGIVFFLRLWEAGHGNSVAGLTSTYGNTAATQNSDENKRIININGNITEDALDDYMERLFRFTNNVANEKLALCGSGFLGVINKLFKSKVNLNSNLPLGDTYGMRIVHLVTPFGDVYFKTHPLFNQNASMRYNSLFLDVQNFHYRYVQGRDTDIRKNIQPNDADYRKDEWLTESGLEMQYPESNMYMVGVTGYA